MSILGMIEANKLAQLYWRCLIAGNMAEMQDLYQEIILEHHKRPRNQRAIVHATHRAKGYNPRCGDEVEIYLSVENGLVTDLSFQGQGCAICMASASILTDHLRGIRLDQVVAKCQCIFESFEPGSGNASAVANASKEIQALIAVKRFPARVRCAILPWEALQGSVIGEKEVSSE